ncbi:hypothetical protein Taro_018719 [Colocasia esculenta]|uniref:Transposase n=1 Tax=Colocasia esculenta TaxID=4460 RepID=A0A843URS5_COLES|nr:hypothetical protein [Colocasia esculenta]
MKGRGKMPLVMYGVQNMLASLSRTRPPTKSQMRTRASTRCLELLKREDEKRQPQAEPQSPVAAHSTTETHPPMQQSIESQHMNSSGASQKRMRTRASMQNSTLVRKGQQPLQPQSIWLQSSVPNQSTHQPQFPQSQSLDSSGSLKCREEPVTHMECFEPLAWEDEQLKPLTKDQEPSHPPNQSQPHCVEPQPPTTMIHSAPQARSPQEKTPEMEQDNYDPNKKRKRTRGPTRCLGFLTREDEQPLCVSANEFGQPIGPNARKLTSFLGTIVRDPKIAPLMWHDWRAMPQRFKDMMWENVQEKFQVGDSLKDWVMMSLATKWRNFKAYLKKKYYDGNAGKDCLVIDDKRVDPAHWQELVHFWDSEKGKLRSSTNKANRSKLYGVHTAGSKSFAMLREELRIKRPDFQNPSQTEVYMVTHTRKDGQPIDEASAVVMAKLSEQVSEQEISECNTPADEILTQLLGENRHGHARTFGLGPSPSDVHGPKPTRTQALQMVSKIKNTTEEKLTKMREQMEAMKAEQEGMKAEQQEMKQKYEDRLTELQTQLQAMMLVVQGSNPNFQVPEQFSSQQLLVSPVSSHLLQPPKVTKKGLVPMGRLSIELIIKNILDFLFFPLELCSAVIMRLALS